MAIDKLPVLRPVSAGYRDAWQAIRAMPMLAGYALLIMFAVNLLDYVFPFRAAEDDVVVGTVVSFAVSAVQNFFLTPIMIAVHRFIVLGDTAPRYALEPGSRVFRAFFGWMMALSALGLLAALLFAPNDLPGLISGVIALLAMVALIVVTIRLSILFPAIAVDAADASAANAWADSKGHTLRIFLIFLLAVLPILVGAILFILWFVLDDDSQTGSELGIAAMVVVSFVQMFFLILCVAIASRLYQALADRLLRSA